MKIKRHENEVFQNGYLITFQVSRCSHHRFSLVQTSFLLSTPNIQTWLLPLSILVLIIINLRDWCTNHLFFNKHTFFFSDSIFVCTGDVTHVACMHADYNIDIEMESLLIVYLVIYVILEARFWRKRKSLRRGSH